MTAYTGTPALPPLLAGDVPSAATDWAAIIAALHALADPWSTYNPAWTTNGTAPVIGNGTLAGRFRQVGKTVDAFVKLVAGSTTTFGTGSWFLTLPVPALAADSQVGNAKYLDATIKGWGGHCWLFSTTQLGLYTPTASDVTNTNPFTWGNGDSATASITYEVA